MFCNSISSMASQCKAMLFRMIFILKFAFELCYLATQKNMLLYFFLNFPRKNMIFVIRTIMEEKDVSNKKCKSSGQELLKFEFLKMTRKTNIFVCIKKVCAFSIRYFSKFWCPLFSFWVPVSFGSLQLRQQKSKFWNLMQACAFLKITLTLW